jgi:hypothetical protein
MLEGFLGHEDPRLRAYAAGLVTRVAEARRERAEWAREEERIYERMEASTAGASEDLTPPAGGQEGAERENPDIPF